MLNKFAARGNLKLVETKRNGIEKASLDPRNPFYTRIFISFSYRLDPWFLFLEFFPLDFDNFLIPQFKAPNLKKNPRNFLAASSTATCPTSPRKTTSRKSLPD